MSPNVRFTLTPSRLLQERRTTLHEQDAPAASPSPLVARPPAPAGELPAWRRPFTLPPNVRFTRTPDIALRRDRCPAFLAQAGDDGAGTGEALSPPQDPRLPELGSHPLPDPLAHLPDEVVWHAFAMLGLPPATRAGIIAAPIESGQGDETTGDRHLDEADPT
jgi:S-DNA-T family DNA segregation ATPase FtsK/SpoIIIE